MLIVVGSSSERIPRVSITTIFSRCGSWSRTSSVLSSCSSSSTITILATELARTWPTSASELVGYTPTVTPPMPWVPRSANSHSGLLSASTATLSPVPTPSSRSPSPTLVARRS